MKHPTQYRAFPVFAATFLALTASGVALPRLAAASGIDESILPTIYQTLWAPGVPGGIPADNDPVRPASVWLPAGDPYHGYSVNPALTGTVNAAAFSSAFQAAINSAGAAATPTSRKIVLLKAGTYFVNPQVNSGGQVGIVVKVDNVTIRGEGAQNTSIIANGQINDYGTVILFGHRTGSSDASFNVQNVTADALKGSTTIQVANASGYVVGDVITIDHLDGPAAANGAVYINGGYLWNYDGIYFKRQPTYTWNGPSTGAPSFNVTDLASSNLAAQNDVPKWRSTMQETEITAINGNTLTIKDPLNIDFPFSMSPQVWRTVPLNTSSIPVGNRWCGLENVRVAGGNNMWGFPGGCIALSYMAYSWVKGVDADGERWTSDPVNHPGKYGYNIGLARSYRCVVRESYSHGATDENPGGQAYGIVLGVGTSASLVENNISLDNDKPVVLNVTGGGNVIGYNYVDKAELWNSPGWLESAIEDCHASFTHNDLVEGNWSANLGGSTTHGNSGFHTYLRNYSNGNNSIDPKTDNLRAVGVFAWMHSHAFIGNVLMGGNVYQTTPSSQNGTPIYQLGALAPYDGSWDNGYALNHTYRDGNWDNVSNAVVWNAGSKTIPASFYLTAKPAFFGSLTWPWVDPTGATRIFTLPAKKRYDTGAPFGPTPAITSAITANGTVGNAFSYQITATNTPFSYGASPLPAGLSIDTAAGLISGTPTSTATVSVLLRATNDNGAGTATLTLTIGSGGGSQPPAITTQPADQVVIVGQTATFTVAATGTAPLSYLWTKNGTPIGGATSASYTTPAATLADNGALFAVKVSNSIGSATSRNATLTVNASNVAPVITSAATAAPNPASVGGAVAFSVSASDADGDTLTYAWDFGDGGKASGVGVSHAYAAAGTYTAKVTVTDTASHSVSSSVSVTVNNAPPPPPAITSPLTATGVVGAAFSYTIAATNQPASFGAAGLPAGLSVNTSTGIISGTPTAAGNSNVTISATNAGGTGSATLAITIAPQPGTLHVAAIAMSLSSTSKGKAAIANVTIRDGSGALVSGATVSGTWSGLTSANVSANTGSNGKARFVSARIKQAGSFTFTVTNVAKSGYTYAASQNAVSSATISTSGIITLASMTAPMALGTVSVNKNVKLALPMPDEMSSGRIHGKAVKAPQGLHVSGGFITGKPTHPGTFIFTVHLAASMKSETVQTMQQYEVVVTP